MSDIQDILATNMRRYRKAAHLSQEGLAERAGLHRTYIGGIEQRRINVSVKNVGKIADALDIDPALLFIAPSADAQARTARKTGGADQRTTSHASPRPKGEGASVSYALASWEDGQSMVRPIHVDYEDLTMRIIHELLERGYRGDDLVARYEEFNSEVVALLQRS